MACPRITTLADLHWGAQKGRVMNRVPAVLFQWILWLALAVSTSVRHCCWNGQPLTLTRGEVRRVRLVGELKTAIQAANRAQVAATLLLANGTYLLDVPAWTSYSRVW